MLGASVGGAVVCEEPIMKSRHTLDFGITCADEKFSRLLEGGNGGGEKAAGSFYAHVHPEDLKCLVEAHEAVVKSCSSGVMVYRVVGRRSGTVYYVQSGFRLFFKNAKPESIGANHRLLTCVLA